MNDISYFSSMRVFCILTQELSLKPGIKYKSTDFSNFYFEIYQRASWQNILYKINHYFLGVYMSGSY